MQNADHSVKLLGWTTNSLLAIVLLVIATIIYWYFEPDPLDVSYISDNSSWSSCEERQWTLLRDVKTSKDLTVQVKEFWWDMDGMRDINGKMNEYPALGQTVYTLTAGTDRVFEFPKGVPDKLPVGRYRYRPHAEYKINPVKTIRRDLPIQYVNVRCDAGDVK